MSRRIGVRTIPSLEAVELPLEGDYSDWTIYDSFDDANVANNDWNQEAVVNKDETEIILANTGNAVLERYIISTKALSTIINNLNWAWSFLATGVSQKSALGTYIVVIWGTISASTNDRLSIIKNGVVVKTLTIAELGFGANPLRSASISNSGKYVVVSGRLDATGNMGWVILVGS